MNIEKRINAFVKLGKKIISEKEQFTRITANLWFTPENISFAIEQLAIALEEKNIVSWTNNYPDLKQEKAPIKIGVITAGNIPLVGFHDFLTVLISGNIFVGKLSSKDDKLMNLLIKILIEIEPEFKNRISIKEDRLSDFEAVIATGSNNSSKYFEYYFGKYPNIIRKNRNSVAVITGNETKEELALLANDIFAYFGLGCRNVSKLFLPENYDLANIFENSLHIQDVRNHNKYGNNYDYNRAVYLMNQVKFWDNGFMILKEDINYASPVSVVFFENYSKLEAVKQRLLFDSEKIQCIVSKENIIENSIYFGKTQSPELWDYADNVDTMEFLLNLNIY